MKNELMIEQKYIEYSEPQYIGSACYQDILHKGENIGCLVSLKGGLLEPIKETYQFCIKEDLTPKGFTIYVTEDKGYAFVQTNNLFSFIKALNSVRK